MRTQSCTFFSDGLRLQGAFLRPDEQADANGRPRPLVIPCSGFTGLMAIHPARFARSLTAAGHQCFAFDYRGFADSEGDRGRVLLEEQVRDIRHAVAFAAANREVDAERIVLLGWGMAGGLILDAVRELPGVVGLIAANGFFNGRRVQRAHRGEEGLAEFEDRVRQERAERAQTNKPRQVDPFDIYPLDANSRTYVDSTLRSFAQYDAETYSFELAESLLRWRPEVYAPELTLPLLIAHGDRNELHPTSEVEHLHERYTGPCETFWIKDAGHTDFMHDDDPRFQALAARVISFVEQCTAVPVS